MDFISLALANWFEAIDDAFAAFASLQAAL
jgi:hypothetical protein